MEQPTCRAPAFLRVSGMDQESYACLLPTFFAEGMSEAVSPLGKERSR